MGLGLGPFEILLMILILGVPLGLVVYLLSKKRR